MPLKWNPLTKWLMLSRHARMRLRVSTTASFAPPLPPLKRAGEPAGDGERPGGLTAAGHVSVYNFAVVTAFGSFGSTSASSFPAVSVDPAIARRVTRPVTPLVSGMTIFMTSTSQ